MCVCLHEGYQNYCVILFTLVEHEGHTIQNTYNVFYCYMFTDFKHCMW